MTVTKCTTTSLSRMNRTHARIYVEIDHAIKYTCVTNLQNGVLVGRTFENGFKRQKILHFTRVPLPSAL
jgi:hypothetical protein